MAALSENIRKITTFLLAVFLWSHALFVLNLQSTFAARCAQYLQLTISETILLALLVIFSFASGSGFWKPFRSLLYIYAFPFVLFWKLLYWFFRALGALNRWFKAQAYQSADTLVVEQKEWPAPPSTTTTAPAKPGAKETTKEFLIFLLRPFRRFTFLWCILLLSATHIQIVWVCLVVLMLHLARRIFGLLKVMLFFDPYMKRAIEKMFDIVGNAVDAVDAFTPGTTPSQELKTRWDEVKTWKIITGFLRDEYLVSRWAWVLGAVSFGAIYVYIALLFSFAYFGIARVSGISYPWTDSLVASLFIPLFARELPKTILFRVLGGIHFSLAVTIGIGTFFGFLHRRLFAIRAAATVVNDKLIDKAFQEKFSILSIKFEVPPGNPPQKQTQVQGRKEANKGKKKKLK
jgi:hypothetical protein